MRHLAAALGAALLVQLCGCATHEMVLSRTLAPDTIQRDFGFVPSLFRARVQMGVLEVWSRVSRLDGDYRPGYELEIATAAALLSELVSQSQTFDSDWSSLRLELTNEYGSQWRWKNTVGSIIVQLSRGQMLDLRDRNVPVADYPRYWRLVLLHKVGPPDFRSQDIMPGAGAAEDVSP